MIHEPYLVVGTGRCGTSTVARIMHNKMGIFMGHEFPPSNITNPDGFWEDIDFYNANKSLIKGYIDFPKWSERVGRTIVEREKLNRPWGFKESRMARLLGLYLAFFKNPKIIVCDRDKELVINSLMRCYSWERKESEDFYRPRKILLDNLLFGLDFLSIHFNGARVPDEEIMCLIEKKWGD